MRNLNLLIKHCLRLTVLVLFAGAAWIVVSLLRFAKSDAGEPTSRKAVGFLPSVLSIPLAHADIPPPPPSSTPFIAVWDGKSYRLENDILFGKPTSFFLSFNDGRRSYESGLISPDLYKIQSKVLKKDGELSFQVQEIEKEESFFHGLTLTRIVHPKNSQVFVGSDYKKFYVLNQRSFEKGLIRPTNVVDNTGRSLLRLVSEMSPRYTSKEIPLWAGDYLDVSFENLQSGVKYYLLLQSRFRKWTPDKLSNQSGDSHSFMRSILNRQLFRTAAPAAALLLASVLTGKTALLSWLPLLPLTESCGCGDSSGGGGGGGTAGCSLLVYSIDAERKMSYITTLNPRALKPVIELTKMPQELFSNSRKFSIRISATDHHYVSFIGLLGEQREATYRAETMKVKYAWHQRLNKEVTELLKYSRGKYLHLIPGDKVDVTFAPAELPVPENRRETYLIRAAGFYTGLSRQSHKLLTDDWETQLSQEAKDWRKSLKSV